MNRRSRVGAAALALSVIGLAGCSGHEPEAGGGSPTRSAADEKAATAQELTDELLGETPAPKALGGSDGTIDKLGTTVPVRAEVLSVDAGTDATRLRWRLTSSEVGADIYSFALSRPPLFDTRAVTLVDPAAKKAYSPFTYVPVSYQNDTRCACSLIPSTVDETGSVLDALYPPLDPGTSTVDVTLPGFAPIKDVKVTR